MTPTDVHHTYKQILSHLSQGGLQNALEKAGSLTAELQLPALKEELQNIESDYRYMLRYFMDGVDDPDRKTIYNKLVARLFVLASQIRDELLTRDSSNFEFTQNRYFPFNPQLGAAQLTEGLKRAERRAEWAEMEPRLVTAEMEKIESEFEHAVRYIFNYFWLNPVYRSDMLALYNAVMNEEYTDSIAKSMLISALTLNLWRTFDEAKLLLLIDACKNKDVYAQQRALVGICFVLAKYNRFLPFFPAVRNRLILLVDEDAIVESLQNAIIQIIATTETDQISKKLQEEIFPELMKLRPVIEKGLTNENLLNTDEWGEINPDWEAMMESGEASEKIHELAEMEQSGADVYMSTFSVLKSFPFFSELSNWFLPFDTNHTAVNRLFQADEKSLVTAFLNANLMCNSDRYSFCMSILQMPDMQRNQMKRSFGDAVEQMEEMNKEEALYSPHVGKKAAAKHYIRDLFRFFKLNAHRADFSNMFSVSLILHKTYLFDLLSSADELKLNVAEYYFSKKLYREALELFDEIEQESGSSAILYQKKGYAYQQTSQLFRALEAYKKADLIQPDDFWTNRKIALCHMLTGDVDNALKTYRHAHFIRPENLSVRLQIVRCLMELRQHDEALESLTQIQRDHPENPAVLRAMILNSFAAKQLSKAAYYADLLPENAQLDAHDCVVAGHIAWCQKKNPDAKKWYEKALQLLENKWDTFVSLFNQDAELLIKNEVDASDIPLILDAIKVERKAIE